MRNLVGGALRPLPIDIGVLKHEVAVFVPCLNQAIELAIDIVGFFPQLPIIEPDSARTIQNAVGFTKPQNATAAITRYTISDSLACLSILPTVRLYSASTLAHPALNQR